ncbi:hypothetical protein [Arthrobacter caoxuetaonis]|uniref:Uncharacterized protein n=1 Tax=Arthrobacter caoxuetaonis TaxID=2886935 RepID=A0A9X1SE31_9MICC|nr:hypothetical protein [Arthrobacter caoxuetaonis]MCC3299773.1 hypothetical protein [Arthrobacter caoxuetaonis]USQ59326.1 hypothetical protein NF551_17230 [Arthrobacter caoxuetaonis]
MTSTKAALNLDELLVINDADPYTYDDGEPNSGIPQALFSQDHFNGPQLKMYYTTHRGTELFRTYSVGGWEEGSYHRIVQDGPRVNGPVAWMNTNDVALTAHKQAEREGILVEDGDHIILRGTEYIINRDSRGYVSLVRA